MIRGIHIAGMCTVLTFAGWFGQDPDGADSARGRGDDNDDHDDAQRHRLGGDIVNSVI